MSRNDRTASRRSIVAAALAGAAFRAVCGSAQADEAPTSGLIRIPAEAGDIGGFHAQPASVGPWPCVVVAGDQPGPPDWTAEMCRRLARAGYLAIAPDLWAGDKEPADAEIMRRLDAACAWAGQHDGDPGRIGLAGFGRGGRVTWLYAAQSESLKAAVAWGGAVAGPTSPTRPKTPLDVAGGLKAPLLGLFGKGDASNSRTLLLRAERSAQDAGRTAEIIVYVGAAANFAEPGRPTYDQAAAMDGWDRMLAWFKRYGVG